jgi:hypothetical protein
MTIKAEILQFMKANPNQRLSMVRVGFELETQKSDGLEWSDVDEDSEIDHDAAEDAISQEARTYFTENVNRRLRDFLSDSLEEKLLDEIAENIRENFDYSDYYMRESASDRIKSQYRLPNIEIVQDGSVSGFEFRTIGGLNVEQFAESCHSVFKIDHEIDTGCSFHIHVSIPGVKHFYGERMQLAMVEYIAENIDRLPVTVLKRIRDIKNNNYIKGLLSSREKYSFVNAHEQGTWEFRCFGNVQNSVDGMTCRDIAVEALQYAYMAVKGDQKLLLDSFEGDHEKILLTALSAGQKLSRTIEVMNEYNRRQEENSVANF